MKPWDRMWNAIGDYFEAKAEDLFEARAEEWLRGYEAGIKALAERVHGMLDERGYPDPNLIRSPFGDREHWWSK